MMSDLPAPVELAEVWLLEHGDGTFGWGAVVVSSAPEDRRPLTIEALDQIFCDSEFPCGVFHR